MQHSLPVACLVDNYMKLPGIGGKTATRLAFYTMDMSEDNVEDFSKSLIQVKENLHSCSICGNITESDPCEICRDVNRDCSAIMVVGQSKDVMASEGMGEYNGLYHVSHDVPSPMDGVGPEEINIKNLIARLQKRDEIKEVTLASDPSPEGEATIMHLAKLTKPAGLKVMRLTAELAAGSDIEYANSITLKRVVQGRMDL